jgi:hypothetical protein
MVGRHEVDHAVAQALPKSLAIFAPANRRSALELRGAFGDFFGRQMKIVRAGFHRDGKAAALCIS